MSFEPHGLAPQAPMHLWERQLRSAVRDQNGNGRYRMVMAAVAPAEHVHAIGADIGQGGRDRVVIGHPGIGN